MFREHPSSLDALTLIDNIIPNYNCKYHLNVNKVNKKYLFID